VPLQQGLRKTVAYFDQLLSGGTAVTRVGR
jgi:hypothetical protein